MLREETINEQVSEQDKEWLTKFNDKERETRINLREIPSFYEDYVKKDKLDDIFGIKVYYYHNDQLGTPNELTNKDGEVVWLADYTAWGNIFKEEYQSQAIGNFVISSKDLQPIRFQGQSFDAETGLHYNRFRYYDPDIGMFISRDPIGLRGGDNVFAYAPNPTGWIDPLGLLDYPSREDAIANLGIKPAVPGLYSHRQGYNITPAQYSKAQEKLINKEWNRIVQNDIKQHLAAGRMEACPPKASGICTSCSNTKWRKYEGDSTVYHCGFDGYLEDRIPNDKNPAPTNECFYDHSGNLVKKGHIDYGCRGTPDYFPSFGGAQSILDHFNLDPGGPPGPSSSDEYMGISEESKAATKAFYKRRQDWLKYDIGRKYGVNHPKPSK